jgi:hypothetical protein
MPNNFTNDRSCVALWLFEAVPGFEEDSIGGNTLVNSGVITAELTIFKEGAASARMNNAAGQSFTVLDPALDAGFPFRSTDGASAKKDITLCAWIHSLITASVGIGHQGILGKWNGNPFTTFALFIDGNNTQFNILKGYNSGNSGEVVQYTTRPDKDIWYHIGLGYQESDKSYYMRVWDDTASDFLGADLTGNFAQETSVTLIDLRVCTVDLFDTLDGYHDEYVVFNQKKSLVDVNNIRKGSFGTPRLEQRLSLDTTDELTL